MLIALFIGSVESTKSHVKKTEEECTEINGQDQPWTVNIEIQGEQCQFKVDIGADLSIMSEANYRALRKPPPSTW